jgi:hypothetical protein
MSRGMSVVVEGTERSRAKDGSVPARTDGEPKQRQRKSDQVHKCNPSLLNTSFV